MTTKFVIYGQSRSGSTLLVELINTHPDVQCDGELFNEDAARIGNRVLLSLVRTFPIPYLLHRRRRAAVKAYGFKLLFYHLPRTRQVMKILALTGWKFVHVYRKNIARQSLSNIVAETTQRWHKRGDDAAGRTESTSALHSCSGRLRSDSAGARGKTISSGVSITSICVTKTTSSGLPTGRRPQTSYRGIWGWRRSSRVM